MGTLIAAASKQRLQERIDFATIKMKLIICIALLCAYVYAAPVEKFECPAELSQLECDQFLAPEDFIELKQYGIIGDKALEIVVNRILKKLDKFDFLIGLIPNDKVKNFIRETVRGKLEEVKALLEKGGFSLLKYLKDLIGKLIAKFLVFPS